MVSLPVLYIIIFTINIVTLGIKDIIYGLFHLSSIFHVLRVCYRLHFVSRLSTDAVEAVTSACIWGKKKDINRKGEA